MAEVFTSQREVLEPQGPQVAMPVVSAILQSLLQEGAGPALSVLLKDIG